MTNEEYKYILKGVYQRASENKALDEYIKTLSSRTYGELREELKKNRLNFQLNNKPIDSMKSVLVDVEMTKRLLR